MNTFKEDAEHVKHEDELVSDLKLNKIYRYQKLLQPTSIKHNNIFALKSNKINVRIVADNSPNFHNHCDHENRENMRLFIYIMLHLFGNSISGCICHII